MTYLSFDPGQNHFSVRLERRYTCPLGMETVAQGKHVVEYTRTSHGTVTTSLMVSSVISILDYYLNLAGNVIDIAVIERQMEDNTAMIRLESVLISYFLMRYPKTFVVDISSKLKGDNLGAPKLKRPQLKRWGEEMAMVLALKRDDKWFLNYIREQVQGKKRSDYKIDDDTDNYIQLEAFCREAGYFLTPDRSVMPALEKFCREIGYQLSYFGIPLASGSNLCQVDGFQLVATGVVIHPATSGKRKIKKSSTQPF